MEKRVSDYPNTKAPKTTLGENPEAFDTLMDFAYPVLERRYMKSLTPSLKSLAVPVSAMSHCAPVGITRDTSGRIPVVTVELF